MQTIKLIILLLFTLLSLKSSFSQEILVSASKENQDRKDAAKIQKARHINFFIISKRKKRKLDLATRFNVFRTTLRSFFFKKKFVAIVVRDSKQMSEKMLRRLKKQNTGIGTIWFDSHGKYARGISNFSIGSDEYNYNTLKDSSCCRYLKELSAFSDQQTKIVIGSCYGGATYWRSSIDYKDSSLMNGDSLMIMLGNIFNDVTIYASESWVMSKPGLFTQQASVAGHPGEKSFWDICYKPAWETIGRWNEYNALTGAFNHINPVTLDNYGNLSIRHKSYSAKEKVKQKIERNIKKLKPWLYK